MGLVRIISDLVDWAWCADTVAGLGLIDGAGFALGLVSVISDLANWACFADTITGLGLIGGATYNNLMIS